MSTYSVSQYHSRKASLDYDGSKLVCILDLLSILEITESFVVWPNKSIQTKLYQYINFLLKAKLTIKHDMKIVLKRLKHINEFSIIKLVIKNY